VDPATQWGPEGRVRSVDFSLGIPLLGLSVDLSISVRPSVRLSTSARLVTAHRSVLSADTDAAAPTAHARNKKAACQPLPAFASHRCAWSIVSCGAGSIALHALSAVHREILVSSNGFLMF